MDSTMPINDARIEGMLQEIFVDRLVDMQGMLKNNLKTMKIKSKFDLRGDGWKQAIIQYWEHSFMPELVSEVKDIKQTPDIKDRAPKMRQFLVGARASFSPMNVLSVMEDEFRNDQDSMVDPDMPDEVTDDSPGFLRRVGSYAGGVAKAAGGAAMYGVMQNTKLLGGLAKIGTAAYGLHKAARGFAKSSSSPSATGRLGSSIKSMFGGKSNVRARSNVDFTPREEQLEGGKDTDILKQIEENTAKLLEKFDRTGKKGEDGGGIFSGIGSSLMSIMRGPLMEAAVIALGATMAAAFGAAAGKYICEKFPMLCKGGMDVHEDDKFAAAQKSSQSQWEKKARSDLAKGTATAYQKKILKEIDAKNAEPLSKMSAGDLTRTLETGSAKGNYGYVNKNDVGQPSYGAYQFRAKEGNLPSYLEGIKNDERYKPIAEKLKGKAPGTEEFNKAWTSLSTDPATKDLFKESQDKSFRAGYYDPAISALSRMGFNADSILVRETAAQLFTVKGAGGGRKVLSAIRNEKGDRDLAKMSDKEQAQAIVDKMKGSVDAGRVKKVQEFVNKSPENSPKLGVTPTAKSTVANDVGTRQMTEAEVDAAIAPRSSVPAAKAPVSKVKGITPIASPDKAAGGNSAPVIVAPQSKNDSSGSSVRPPHYNSEDSIAKLVIENNTNTFGH